MATSSATVTAVAVVLADDTVDNTGLQVAHLHLLARHHQSQTHSRHHTLLSPSATRALFEKRYQISPSSQSTC